MKKLIPVSVDNSIFKIPGDLVTRYPAFFEELYFLKLATLGVNKDRSFFFSLLLSKEECLQLAEKWKTQSPSLNEIDQAYLSSTHDLVVKKSFVPERLDLILVHFLSYAHVEKQSVPQEYLMKTIDECDYKVYQKEKLKEKVSNLK